MQADDKTVHVSSVREQTPIENISVTIFDGLKDPQTLSLDSFGKARISFGRSPENDIRLESALVSGMHGRFERDGQQWLIQDKGAYEAHPSTNGLIYNNAEIRSRRLCEGDFVRIDDNVESVQDGVLFVFSAAETGNRWKSIDLTGQDSLTIGRSVDCDIVLPHISVSKEHARIMQENGNYIIADCNSTNGILVNYTPVRDRQILHEKDVITITNSKLIFTSRAIYYCSYVGGISVDVSDVVIRRGSGRKSFITGNHVSLNIKPGELVAIIGGSGAGKSTILNCMCGYLPPAEGNVFINGINLYQNFDSLKKLIGYVPQSDIVYDDLTLYDMLLYTAKMRLPRDVSEVEREDAIRKAIDMVELTEKKGSLIKSLSGGQRKRASIAVELLSDPNLLYLDEPASGLDPGTERNLMKSLRGMADAGKTVILVTHSTLQLRMCDKVVFMGKGGNLCFFGSYDEALEYFGISDIVDVYRLITDDAPHWKEKYDAANVPPAARRETSAPAGKIRRQPNLPILCNRYFKLILNDRKKIGMLLLQAPVLAALISLVANGEQFHQYEMTKSLLFVLSCAGIWMGMSNSIQEIVKERTILRREYMTGLSLGAYITSKLIVLGVVCLLQSLCLVGLFSWLVSLPEEGIVILPFMELLITTSLTTIASAAMGLVVSALVNNTDRAMTFAPILLIPQILFSGVIFKLEGVINVVSWFAISRWSMEGYGTSANLNSLDLKLQQEGIMIPHEAEDFFEFTSEHIFTAWLVLAGFILGFSLLSRLLLNSLRKEKG